MRNAFNKDVYREIKNTFGRFMGIFAIVALGVSFFSGIGATGDDMRITGNAYYTAQNLMDIRVVSSYGINRNDLKSLQQVEGIRQIQPTFNMDATVTNNGVSQIIKVHGLDIKLKSEDQINRPVLLEGRLPLKGNEALVEKDFLNALGLNIGDTFTLDSGKKNDIRNNLKTNTYKIVGVIRSAYYISQERGSGSIGSGKVDCFIMIPQENFLQSIYSEVFMTVKGVEGYSSFSNHYKDTVEKMVDSIEDIGDVRIQERYRELTRRSYEKLNESEKKLQQSEIEAKMQFSDLEKELTNASEQLEQERENITTKQSELNNNLTAVESNIMKLTSALQTLNNTEHSLKTQENELMDGIRLLESSETELSEAEADLQKQEKQLKQIYSGVQLELAMSAISEGKKTIADNRLELESKQQEANSGLRAIADGIEEIRLNRISLNTTLQSLYDTKQQLIDAQATITDGSNQLADNQNEIDQNVSTLKDSTIQTTDSLQEAKAQVEKARKALDDLNEPKWYVLDRDTNLGYSSFSEDSDKIEAIGKVFPLIFFLVAALVCLTTTTRLVEERRVEIGTLKSLGYGNFKIMSKYILYALTPTLAGGIIGGAIGMRLYPKLIIDAYSMFYAIPTAQTPFNTFYWVTGVLFGVVCTVFSAVFSCMNELKSTPANLMRPKAPKAGKRTIFEKIKLLWSILSFTQKVTLRNLIRYKKRFFMTVIGIGGCTALLMTGFGVRDSVSDIIGKQYTELCKYDMITSFKDDTKEKEIKQVNDILQSSSIGKKSMKLKLKAMDALSDSGKSQSVNLVVPEKTSELQEFISFRERKSKKPLTITSGGVIITEKLAKLLKLAVGDEISIKDGDTVKVEAKVTGITENYLIHYIYMPPELYDNLFEEEIEYNTIYTVLSNATVEKRDELANTLLDKNSVTAVTFTQTIIENFGETINSLNFVVFVLILSAGALSFVVLLNLTSINISERVRELATIEVLGFYDREVSAYVYRENIVLTIIGIGLGLFLGIGLHLYVISTAETEIMMFGQQIKPLSFLFSVLLTVFFSVCVNMFTSRKLKKIDMVEALKSVE